MTEPPKKRGRPKGSKNKSSGNPVGRPPTGGHKKGKRGQKKCPTCKSIIGCRTLKCDCGHEFKVKLKKNAIENWQNLEIGTIIRVPQSGGNYYLDWQGEKILMSDSGIGVVKAIKPDGLLLYFSEGGYSFLYMGPDSYEEETGIYRRAKRNITLAQPKVRR